MIREPSVFELVGFAADLVGNEGHFIIGDAVVESDDKVYVVSTTSDWKKEDLRPVREDQRRFIYWLSSKTPTSIQEGQSVWLAGPQFVSKLAQASPVKLEAFRSKFLGWPEFRKFRWSVGSDSDFRSLNLQLARSLQQLMHQVLFDANAFSFGNPEILYDIFSVLDVPDQAEFELTKALYFDEQRDEYSRKFVAENAVLDGLFKHRAEFEIRLRLLKLRLRRRRLHESRKREYHLVTRGLRSVRDLDKLAALSARKHYHRDQSKSILAGMWQGYHGSQGSKVIAAANFEEMIKFNNSGPFLNDKPFSRGGNRLISDPNPLIVHGELLNANSDLKGEYGSR
jgi:hypothetical protein